jgi:dipeptidase
MCDTFVALGNATKDGSVIFGKNSDREPNEAHELTFIPHAQHQKRSQIQCTYIEVPQVSETYAVLLSKPFWIWGAEMGANEHGVVIGNEALFTKVPYDKSPGLIGMDFLRLALERASTAEQALDVMVDLLEHYGQGGNCGLSHTMFYHNGFLIADRDQAWVFETAGKHWAAEKVMDVRSISNKISIKKEWDRASEGLEDFAFRQGWCKSHEDFDFSKCFSDIIYTKFSEGKYWHCRTMGLLEQAKGSIDLPFAMQLLRDHGTQTGEVWQPGKGLTGAEICMHASFGPIRISQTAESMISQLAPGGDTHWVTGTAAPCTSIFKPVWIDSGLPDLGPKPSATYDEATLWWRHENLHREILRDYGERIEIITDERDALEKELIQEVPKIIKKPLEARFDYTRHVFEQADQHESNWLSEIIKLPLKDRRSLFDKLAWKKFDRIAQR